MNPTLEGSGALSAMDLNMPRSKGIVIGFWIVTALFCLQIGFTAYAQLSLPQVARRSLTLASPTTSGWSSRGPSSWEWCCCLRQCRRGSKSGPTPASPSPSALRSLPTSR
jgi:hypothetical protein